jgi:hypothetical protein
VQPVNRHSVVQLAVLVRELAIDIDIPDLLAIGEFGYVLVNPTFAVVGLNSDFQ